MSSILAFLLGRVGHRESSGTHRPANLEHEATNMKEVASNMVDAMTDT